MFRNLATGGGLTTMIALVLVMIGDGAAAVEPLKASELRTLCLVYEADPEDPAGLACAVYIKGFLDGAIATDRRVAENVVNELQGSDTFAQRSLRTIDSRIREFGASVYADFCVGQPVPVREVVTRVIKELALQPASEDGPAQEILYGTLRKYYPCRDVERGGG